jgi:CubicO group peptidase (beta-lactamase class C family)
MSDVNDAIRELVEAQVGDGTQIGIQVAAVLDGEVVVDVAAGSMGSDDDRPVRADTLFASFSVTKGVAALALAQLVDRGLLDVDEPVAAVWPEFAANGKDAVTVAQAVSHQAGLHAMPEPFAPDHLTDWDAGVARMAHARPAWEPGAAVGYHAVTFGWIVGGIVAGATGRQIRDWVRTEIAEPLGVAGEMSIGVGGATDEPERFATIEIVAAGDGLDIPADSDFYRAMPRAMWEHYNSAEARRACMPGANGHFSARALARLYGALAAGGEIDGVRLVGADALAVATRIRARATDRVLGIPLRYGLGFQLGGTMPVAGGGEVHGAMGPRESTFGHGGAGGSTAFADPVTGLGVAVTINKMAYPAPGTGPTVEICDLIRSAV